MRIHVRRVESVPMHTIPYEYPEQGGEVVSASFPIYRAYGHGLPPGLGALLVTSDLQGREPDWSNPVGKRRLLGELVAEELHILCELGELPSAETTGVLLAGDLYVAEDLGKRGGKGDVRDVWRCFRDRFRWVVGVAGNHDQFSERSLPPDEFLSEPGIHYLDHGVVSLDGVDFGGVGGVVGNPSKPFRHDEHSFLKALEAVAAQRPDIIVLHEGPSGQTKNRSGNHAVRALFERLPSALVVCGHSHWQEPKQEELPNGTQILNCDARAYIIQNERQAAPPF
jgi:3',5'-cyclic-AMP phosphodiesterase